MQKPILDPRFTADKHTKKEGRKKNPESEQQVLQQISTQKEGRTEGRKEEKSGVRAAGFTADKHAERKKEGR